MITAWKIQFRMSCISEERQQENSKSWKNVNWKKKEKEMSKEEANEVVMIRRWIQILDRYFVCRVLWNKEYVGLFSRIVQIYGAAKDNYRGIRFQCIYSLRYAAENRIVKVKDLLKGGEVDAVLEEMQRPTLNDEIADKILKFFVNISKRLKKKKEGEMEEEERKELKRKVFDKLEEEGYEDIITSFPEKSFFKGNYNYFLS